MEKIIIGFQGRVFVSGVSAGIGGLEDTEAFGRSVFGVAILMEHIVAGSDEDDGREDGDRYRPSEKEAGESTSGGEREDGGKHGEEAPGELEELKFGKMAPERSREWREHENERDRERDQKC